MRDVALVLLTIVIVFAPSLAVAVWIDRRRTRAN